MALTVMKKKKKNKTQSGQLCCAYSAAKVDIIVVFKYNLRENSDSNAVCRRCRTVICGRY